MMSWMLLCVAVAARAQSFQAVPASVRQGETLRLDAPPAAVEARMNGRTVRLFPSGPAAAGLMPVAVLDKPGTYPLDFLDRGGAVLHSVPITVRDARFPRQSITLSAETSSL